MAVGLGSLIAMLEESPFSLILKLATLWTGILVLPLIERTILGARTYYGLFIGLGLVFVLYGLTIRSIFAFLQHTRREPFYVWIMFHYHPTGNKNSSRALGLKRVC